MYMVCYNHWPLLESFLQSDSCILSSYLADFSYLAEISLNIRNTEAVWHLLSKYLIKQVVFFFHCNTMFFPHN